MKRQDNPITQMKSRPLPPELRLLASLNNAASIFVTAPQYRIIAKGFIRDLAWQRLPKSISPSHAEPMLAREVDDLLSRRPPSDELEEFCERMRRALEDREKWCRCAMEALKAGGGSVADPKSDNGADNWSNRLAATLCRAQKRMLLGHEVVAGVYDSVMDEEIRLMVEVGAELRKAAEELDGAIELNGKPKPIGRSPIKATDAVKGYDVTISTIKRRLKDGKLTDLRQPGSLKKGAPILLDESEVEKQFSRREVARTAQSK